MAGNRLRMKAFLLGSCTSLGFPRGSLAKVVPGRQTQVAVSLAGQLRLQPLFVRC